MRRCSGILGEEGVGLCSVVCSLHDGHDNDDNDDRDGKTDDDPHLLSRVGCNQTICFSTRFVQPTFMSFHLSPTGTEDIERRMRCRTDLGLTTCSVWMIVSVIALPTVNVTKQRTFRTRFAPRRKPCADTAKLSTIQSQKSVYGQSKACIGGCEARGLHADLSDEHQPIRSVRTCLILKLV